MQAIQKTFTPKAFGETFNKSPDLMVKSPGRINLIGEHTDYNGGLVMPAAIDKHISFAIAKSENATEIFSLQQNELFTISSEKLELSKVKWQNYFIGIIAILQEKLNIQLPYFQLVFGGNIPLGAGLSSSASLTCGFIFSLNELFHLKLSKWEMAKIAQQCEHEYIDVKCGIMDQFAVLFGEKNGALKLDCSTLEYDVFQFDLKEHQFLLCNSMVSHNLADSAYNERKQQCDKALEILNSKGKGYQNLSEASLSDLQFFESENVLYKRANHIITENERVRVMTLALENQDIERIGVLLNQSHTSLRDNYEVTCQETDFLFTEINNVKGVAGCRQMGGGFGGCMLILAESKSIANLKESIQKSYKSKFNLNPEFYEINISEGCYLVKN